VKERLPRGIERLVVEILGREGRPVNGLKARIGALDDVALNQ
jgi:hypothetical protein